MKFTKDEYEFAKEIYGMTLKEAERDVIEAKDVVEFIDKVVGKEEDERVRFMGFLEDVEFFYSEFGFLPHKLFLKLKEKWGVRIEFEEILGWLE